MDWKLEVVVVPVSDVDRAKQFYSEQVGFHVDVDHRPSERFRVVQLTPPGSACSVTIGTGLSDAAPGSVKGLQLVVADVAAARAELAGRGVDVTPVRHVVDGVWTDGHGGPWNSFCFFKDPDGNSWAVQEKPAPGGAASAEAGSAETAGAGPVAAGTYDGPVGTVTSAVPVLHVRRMEAAERFYCDGLGFRQAFVYRPPGVEGDPCYTRVERDGVALEISSFAGDGVAGGLVNVYTDAVDALHAEFVARGVSVDTAPVDQPWGTRDLYVKDADGNSVRFLQRSSA